MLTCYGEYVLKQGPKSARTAQVFGLLLLAVCAHAQTGGEAKVMILSGQVSVLRGNATWALNEGDIIKPSQTIVSGQDGRAVLRVADGSTIDVYPNSRFIFRNTPGNLKDLVDLLLGKIRVKIEHFGDVPNHNTVRTPTAVIAVRGTTFDVAYDDNDETTSVRCEEGRVEVSHLLMPGKGRTLNAGEEVTVFKNQPLAKSVVDHGDIQNRIFRGLADVANEILLHRSPGGSGTGTGTSTQTSGDKGTNGPSGPPPPAPPKP